MSTASNLMIRFKGCFSMWWLLTAVAARSASETSTINADNRFAYGANLGWIDCRANTSNGAVIGQYVCAGYLFSANVGWISLGNGRPANQVRYQNVSSADFGVNHDGLGNLSGYAYGANIGWIFFGPIGAPKVDLRTGRLSGSIYSANCGWISLSNTMAFVQTDTLSPGSLDVNGLPIAWEIAWFGQTQVDRNADPDGDGSSNWEEYQAGTNPLDRNSELRLISMSAQSEGATTTLTWKSVPTRLYSIEDSFSLSPENWSTNGLGLVSPDGDTTTRTLSSPSATARFYRVRALLPLSP
jgi:hypothetical protein